MKCVMHSFANSKPLRQKISNIYEFINEPIKFYEYIYLPMDPRKQIGFACFLKNMLIFAKGLLCSRLRCLGLKLHKTFRL